MLVESLIKITSEIIKKCQQIKKSHQDRKAPLKNPLKPPISIPPQHPPTFIKNQYQDFDFSRTFRKTPQNPYSLADTIETGHQDQRL